MVQHHGVPVIHKTIYVLIEVIHKSYLLKSKPINISMKTIVLVTGGFDPSLDK